MIDPRGGPRAIRGGVRDRAAGGSARDPRPPLLERERERDARGEEGGRRGGGSGRRKNADFGLMIGHDQGICARLHGLFNEYMNALSAWLYNPGLLKSLLLSLAWR